MSAPGAGRALVTGATGFLGGHVARLLAGRGAAVRALVRSPERAADLAAPGIELAEGDLGDAASLGRACEGCAVVHHLAAAIQGNRAKLVRVNVEGTRRLVETAAAAGVRRLVLASSASVHGSVRSVPADEDTPISLEDDYARSKHGAEEAARGAAGPMELVVLRPAWVYGPGDERRTGKLFRAIARGRFAMVGSGRTPVHPVYVEDAAEAFCLAGEVAGAAGGVYLIAGPEHVTVAELCARLAEALGRGRPKLRVPVALARAGAFAAETLWRLAGREPPVTRRTLRFFTRPNAFACGRAGRELGWRPRVGLAEGLARTAAAYREGGLL